MTAQILDFNYYLRRKQAEKATYDVAEVVERLEHPGAVIELKRRVQTWFDLCSQRAAS